ncbi:hypothetical protein [Nonomuraea wenchangensis]|uniref:hypothetical protein n=1 Tax=Nonomuraea wenchangensis TaxID=568860 RepID=UPI00332CBB4B
MSIISPLPEDPARQPDTALGVLALCAYEFGPEPGAPLLRRALRTAILVSRYGIDPREALDIAMYGTDSRAYEAGEEADRLIELARREAFAAEIDGGVE